MILLHLPFYIKTVNYVVWRAGLLGTSSTFGSRALDDQDGAMAMVDTVVTGATDKGSTRK